MAYLKKNFFSESRRKKFSKTENNFQKKTQKKSLKNGRRAIVVLFFLTVLACLFFYFKTEFFFIWEKITGPVVVSTLPSKNTFNPSPVLGKIENLTQNLRGTYGVWVYRLESGESYGFNENQVFTAASLIKLPVMLTVYLETEENSLNLEEYRDRLEAMGQRSDNAAFNRTVKFLGETKIQETIDYLEMGKTSFAQNKTTPRDIGLFFQKLYQGNLISNQHQEEFFLFLTNSIYEDRIPAGVPAGTRVVHKIGTEIGAFADAGIIFAQKPFVLVIMSDGAREAEANEVLPQIAKTIWEFET